MDFNSNSADAIMATVIAKLNELTASVQRIEAGLTERIIQIETREEDTVKDVGDLKMWRAEINGKIVIICLIVSGVGTTLGSVFVAVVSRYFSK